MYIHLLLSLTVRWRDSKVCVSKRRAAPKRRAGYKDGRGVKKLGKIKLSYFIYDHLVTITACVRYVVVLFSRSLTLD